MNLRRVNRIIADLLEQRRRNFEKVLQAIAFDKDQYRRGNYDAKPLLELWDRRVAEYRATHSKVDGEGIHYFGQKEFCLVRGVSERAINRMRATGWVTEQTADTICCALLVPLETIYPYQQLELREAV